MNDTAVFQRLNAGIPVDMDHDEAFRSDVIAEYGRSNGLCFEIAHTSPSRRPRRARAGALRGRPRRACLPHAALRVDYGHQVTLGRQVFANHDLTLMAAGGITIGDGAMIGPHATILTANHDLDNLRVLVCKPVTVGEGAWIGANATILPGVHIGKHAVIGSGSVVTHDVPDDTIAVGNPARPLRTIDRSKNERQH